MYATASDSNFYRSTDFGNSWNSIYKSNGNAVKSFADDSEGNLFILLSGTGVLRSADNGIIWEEINSGLDNVSLNNLIITDNDYILAGTSGEGVYKSVNKTTSLENSFAELPASFLLEQNYPNPFNPTTNIRFKIAESGYVSLKIFDVLGNEIETLISGEKPSGDYEVKFDGRSLSSGIYFYQLRSGEIIQTKKMILIR
ncbi:MAG: T9SS type A sorting domain-containing protein [Ignavibacteriaceae bacterium]|nr:T9SS type A sorting domain-containing protein [Ignavibacteriaceae bacterium]